MYTALSLVAVVAAAATEVTIEEECEDPRSDANC